MVGVMDLAGRGLRFRALGRNVVVDRRNLYGSEGVLIVGDPQLPVSLRRVVTPDALASLIANLLNDGHDLPSSFECGELWDALQQGERNRFLKRLKRDTSDADFWEKTTSELASMKFSDLPEQLGRYLIYACVDSTFSIRQFHLYAPSG